MANTLIVSFQGQQYMARMRKGDDFVDIYRVYEYGEEEKPCFSYIPKDYNSGHLDEEELKSYVKFIHGAITFEQLAGELGVDLPRFMDFNDKGSF